MYVIVMNHVCCVVYQDFFKIFFYVDKIIAIIPVSNVFTFTISNVSQLVMYSHSQL